jgi:hypothetical protein
MWFVEVEHKLRWGIHSHSVLRRPLHALKKLKDAIAIEFSGFFFNFFCTEEKWVSVTKKIYIELTLRVHFYRSQDVHESVFGRFGKARRNLQVVEFISSQWHPKPLLTTAVHVIRR